MTLTWDYDGERKLDIVKVEDGVEMSRSMDVSSPHVFDELLSNTDYTFKLGNDFDGWVEVSTKTKEVVIP